MFLHDLSAASSPISTFSFFSPSLHTSSKTQRAAGLREFHARAAPFSLANFSFRTNVRKTVGGGSKEKANTRRVRILESRTENERECRVRGTHGGKVREAVEAKGQRAVFRACEGRADRERIPSIQFGSS